MVVLFVGGLPLGPVELILILAVVVLIFGAGKLADVGGALGKSIKEFRKASNDEARPQDKTSQAPQAQLATAPVAGATPANAVAAPVALCGNPDCRAELPANAQFCLKCGTRVGAPVAPAS